MSIRAWHFRIEDILESLSGIAADIEDLDYDQFIGDRKTRNSVLLNFKVRLYGLGICKNNDNNKMDCRGIRQRFINFFSQQKFLLLPSAPMLHPSIPMSFVMSAGLVQVETVLSELNLQQSQHFTLIQNCFRHFDLDTVGVKLNDFLSTWTLA